MSPVTIASTLEPTAVEFGERQLPARIVIEPSLKVLLDGGPLAVQQCKPSGIPIASLDDHVLFEDGLKAEAEA